MPGQPLVDERMARAQEIDDAAILPQDTVQEKPHLRPESIAQILVEVGIETRIGIARVQAANAEPLVRKIGHERLGTGVFKHAADLPRIDFGLAELAAFRECQKLVVGTLAP